MKSNILIGTILIGLVVGGYYFLNTDKGQQIIAGANQNNISEAILYTDAYALVKQGKLVHCKMNDVTEFYFNDLGQMNKYENRTQNEDGVISLVIDNKLYLWGTKSKNGKIIDYSTEDRNSSVEYTLTMSKEELQNESYNITPECFVYSDKRADEIFAIPQDVVFK